MAMRLHGRQELIMKLTGIFPQVKTEKVQLKKSGGEVASNADSGKTIPADKVELSAGSQDVQKAKAILAQTPDVRVDKVQALKERIADGDYTVDPHRIADSMLTSLLSETVN
jgi:negative regulator of flagellin synthesis FlgM